MYQQISVKDVVCRKIHNCEWCGELINAGGKANHRAYKYDGYFHSDYMHPECVEGMRKSDSRDMEDGFEPGAQLRGGLLDSREALYWEAKRKGATK